MLIYYWIIVNRPPLEIMNLISWASVLVNRERFVKVIANSKISNTKDMYLVLFDITQFIFLVRHYELYFREFNFAAWTWQYDNYVLRLTFVMNRLKINL